MLFIENITQNSNFPGSEDLKHYISEIQYHFEGIQKSYAEVEYHLKKIKSLQDDLKSLKGVT